MTDYVFYTIHREIYGQADDREKPYNEINGPYTTSFSDVLSRESAVISWQNAYIIAVIDNRLYYPAERMEYRWVINDAWWDRFDRAAFDAGVRDHLYENPDHFTFRKRSDPYRWYVEGAG